MNNFNKSNFFEKTFGVFIDIDAPDREPDYISETGSKYWYTQYGVYRESDHWNMWIGSCFWTIDSPFINCVICGFCNWHIFSEIVIYVNDIFSKKLQRYLQTEYPNMDIILLSTCESVTLLGDNDEKYYPTIDMIHTSIQDQYVFTWSYGVKNYK